MKEKIQKIIINNQEFILRPSNNNDYDFTFNLLKENMLESFERNWGGWNDKSFKDNYHKENIRIIEFDNKKEGTLILSSKRTADISTISSYLRK